MDLDVSEQSEQRDQNRSNKKRTREEQKEQGSSAKEPNAEKKLVASKFRCSPNHLTHFTKVDPFNQQNTLTGYISKKENHFCGSLYITHVNGLTLSEPQIIWGTPKLGYPYRDYESKEFKKFPKQVKKYYIANKWNGMNVLFYKYRDFHGNTFITAKSKGTPFLANAAYGSFLSNTLEALGILKPEENSMKKRGAADTTTNTTSSMETETGGESAADSNTDEEASLFVYASVDSIPDVKFDLHKSPPALLEVLAKDDQVQSMSFELCGFADPHLVKYDFPLRLMPLFMTFNDASIAPIVTDDGNILGPFDFDQKKVEEHCKELQEKDLKANEEFRQQHNLKHKYEYNHFAIEGRVLYLVDARGRVVDRTMYKIKPSDIEEVHFQNFDDTMQGRVREAIQKMREREKPMNEKSLQEELDMGPKEWGKFGRKVIDYVETVLQPEGFKVTNDPRHLLVCVGLPGSGKTWFATSLQKRNPYDWKKSWEVVSARELQTRTACRAKMEQAFKKRQSVVADSLNYTPEQRSWWITEAAKLGVHQSIAIHFDVPPEVCNARTIREDATTSTTSNTSTSSDLLEYAQQQQQQQQHNTTSGDALPTTTTTMIVPPTKSEGFMEVVTVHTEQEAHAALERFATWWDKQPAAKQQQCTQ